MAKNVKFLRILFTVILFALSNHLYSQNKGEVTKKDTVKNYYCEYCGQKFRSVANLTQNWCLRHPDGTNKGKHKLYEGREKNKYTCKYCGMSYNSISALTLNWCLKHPEGTNKGKHAPAL
jgi:protein-arginine kinase activator protein McsA